MPNLNIDAGVIRLTINDDPDRVVTFSPHDVTFRQRFYEVYSDLRKQLAPMEAREAELLKNTEEDEFGVPLNQGERAALDLEAVGLARQKIDELFGAGTSQTVFGDAMNPFAIGQFLEGVQPFFETAIGQGVSKYTRPAAANGKKVMRAKRSR